MHFNHAFSVVYVINIFLLVNNTAFDLSSYGHRKRELSYNNYPASNVGATDPRDNSNNQQQNQINDPGYTKQHENEDLKKALIDKNISLTSAQNWLELLNASGQMFHVIYMLPNPQKRELNALQTHTDSARQQTNGAIENLAYAGPHLFPTQLDEFNHKNMQPLNLPFKNFNNALQNSYNNPLLPAQYYQNLVKDSKVVGTKMEAPFIASQFLGYDQNQKQQFVQHNQPLQQQQQQMVQQRQILPAQNQLLTQHNQQLLTQLNPMLLSPQQQQSLKTTPVYEHQRDLPFQSSNLIYMSPNNMYNLYRKPN